MKVLVADDESLARQAIVVLLEKQPRIEKILQAKDGKQALALYQSHMPEVVFLDIEMPGMSGLQLAQMLEPSCVLVFVTAYDQYAVTAFELSAIDYLLKPFDNERFQSTFNRIEERIKEQHLEDYRQMGQLFRHMLEERDKTFRSRLVVKDPGRIRLVDVEQIIYIQGAGNYAEVHLLDGKRVLHRETLGSLELQLNPEHFTRIHRSTIVRISFVTELRPSEKGDYHVILKNDKELTLSRGHKQKLAALIG